jgi:hypothetical protein
MLRLTAPLDFTARLSRVRQDCVRFAASPEAQQQAHP